MRVYSQLVFALFAVVSVAACDSMALDAPEAVDDQDRSLEADVLPHRQDYFTAVRYEGRYKIKAVNKPVTRCVDGNYQPECKIATLDISALGLSPLEEARFRFLVDSGKTVLKGTLIGPELDAPAGELAVEEGWMPADRAEPEGTFYHLMDTDRVCVTVPCFSFVAAKLNDFLVRRVSNLVWDTPPDEEDAQLLRTTGLLVTGTIDSDLPRPMPPFPLPPLPLPYQRPVKLHIVHHYTPVVPGSLLPQPL